MCSFSQQTFWYCLRVPIVQTLYYNGIRYTEIKKNPCRSLTAYINKCDEYYEREVPDAMGAFNRGPNTAWGGGVQGRVFVFIFYCCHKFNSLKQYPFIMSQLCRSEVLTGFSVQGLPGLSQGYQLAWGLTWSVWGSSILPGSVRLFTNLCCISLTSYSVLSQKKALLLRIYLIISDPPG